MQVDLESVAGAIGDPRRIRVLMALADGRALPAGRLAAEAGVAPSTVTGHLNILREHGLVDARQEGRRRYYRLANPQVEGLLEVLSELAPQRPITSLREHTRAHALRAGRTCYRHLAGRLGVDVFRGMLDLGWVTGGDGALAPGEHLSAPGRTVEYRLTELGARRLGELGVAPQAGRLKYCADWTEQRHHLAGPLGTAVCDAVFARGWVERTKVHRAVRLTDAGRAGLAGIYEERRSA
ncbi:helix-turn-helix transcriptional regulator [Tsukamurella sp. 1534]|uniref:ArsR/SmtB family transcription factor n=1 Tax=Tsukamurella sp. 1534 TaxID=1151061 RepID=UPI000315048C|nr:metalloregulator ArsR/SmtB family transcription factor [Tsukamurella sp. 1534]